MMASMVQGLFWPQKGFWYSWSWYTHEKPEHCGVRGIPKDWFLSCLKGRKQFVETENETSTTNEILTGVPQGLMLGPLLVFICINDPNTCIELAKTYHFADDTSILHSNKSLYGSLT